FRVALFCGLAEYEIGVISCTKVSGDLFNGFGFGAFAYFAVVLLEYVERSRVGYYSVVGLG
ncbi:MAG: hypothetical protein RBR89_06295, partial [Candidatus Bipolaricaulis sp.]|nr:hypothetical protein [Candidatus Bipolaricaulis sp.]